MKSVFAAALAAGCIAQAAAQPAHIEMGVGHFHRDGKAFHYWDKEKEIPAVCARCHSAVGIPQYLKEGKNTPAPHVKNGYACTNCHADMLTYERHKVEKVTFASGVTLDSGDNNTNLCMTCHQGRESTASVNKAIGELPADTPEPKLAFVHVHYFPAGAMRYGTQAKIGYEYQGKTYAGRFAHVPGMDTCTGCHEPHGGHLKQEKCASCHKEGRPEARARDIKAQMTQLYAAIQQYARTVGGTSIAFSPAAFPYWYADTNGNGQIDADELKPTNSYKAYTPRLVQATYNYTFVLRDPGAGYHNGRYAQQLLHDTLESLAASGKAGVDMKGRPRP
jgi:hypothetical protein